MKAHALKHFRRPPMMLNCAQSVLYAYQQIYGESLFSLEQMKSSGGGRAPGGLCGALHAACSLLPDKAEQLKNRFAQKTGSILCKEMRAANQHPCEVCVSESAHLLENELGASSAQTE
jgi:hypothetical protein